MFAWLNNSFAKLSTSMRGHSEDGVCRSKGRLPYVLDVPARARSVSEHVQLSRPHAAGSAGGRRTRLGWCVTTTGFHVAFGELAAVWVVAFMAVRPNILQSGRRFDKTTPPTIRSLRRWLTDVGRS